MDGTKIGPPALNDQYRDEDAALVVPGRRGGVTGTAPIAAMG